MSAISRRGFIGSTVAAALYASTARAAAGERVRHAVIGQGSQGRHHAEKFASNPDCDLVAICDLDPERLAKSGAKFPKATQVDDYRRILDNAEIDSVSIATPDHWHTPLALAALKAGKHVYVEKPCSHNVLEGIVLAEAVKKSGKCVQHGTQGRSGAGIKAAVQFMRDGGIGKVRMAKAINHQLREPIGRAAESDPPAGVNYDMWLGPAPLHAFTKNRWHYEWHWFWDYGSGDLGNDGIHQVDEARWGLGVGMPNAVSASGGQLFYKDDHETPDTQVVTFEYDECYLMYEMRLWTDYPLEGHDNGVVFYGDKGIVEIGRRGCEYTLKGEEKKRIGDGPDIDANVRNFLDCVKTNNPAGLNAPISEGAVSAHLCHLGNIATRLGRRLKIDPAKIEVIGDDDANKMLARTYRKGYELPVV